MGRLIRISPRASAFSALNAPSTVVYNPDPSLFRWTPPSTYLDSRYDPGGSALTWASDITLTDSANVETNAAALQDAIDDASTRVGHSRIKLPSGFNAVGVIRLRKHTQGAFWTYIEWTGIAAAQAEGVQANAGTVATSHASAPQIQSESFGAGSVWCDNGADYTRLVGLRFTAPSANLTYRLVYFHGTVGSEEQQADTLAKLPQWVGLDRCWVDGGNISRVINGVVQNTRESFVVDSVINGNYANGLESHGIITYNGVGPHKIVGNAIEAGSINYLCGGVDPTLLGLQTSDVEVRRNYWFKRAAWNKNGPTWDTITGKICKNLFELKWGQRYLVEGNIFDGNYHDGGQQGACIVWKTENSGGNNDTAETHDVTFRYNLIKNSSGYAEFQGIGDMAGGGPPNAPLYRVHHQHNLAYNIGADQFAESDGGSGLINGKAYFYNNGANRIVVDHETVVLHQSLATTSWAIPWMFSGTDDELDIEYINSILAAPLADSGARTILGSGDQVVGPPDNGNTTLAAYAPDALFNDSVLVRQAGGADYPANCEYPASVTAVGFEDVATLDFRLDAASAFKGLCADGSDPGPNVVTLLSAIAGVQP